MTERKKFVFLLVLLIASVVLLLYVRSTFGQDFAQNL